MPTEAETGIEAERQRVTRKDRKADRYTWKLIYRHAGRQTDRSKNKN